MTFGGIIFLLVFVGLIVAIVVTYKKLVGLRQRSEQAWSDIDVQLKRRTDLVPNLIPDPLGIFRFACSVARPLRYLAAQSSP